MRKVARGPCGSERTRAALSSAARLFAARFTELVGEPPLSYLTRLPMQKAAGLLREGAPLAKVSHLTGYSSEASISHAFRKWAGMAPGAWRRRLQSRAPSAGA